MDVYFSKQEVIDIVTEGCRIGYRMALADAGITTKYLSQNRAYRKFGRVRVEHWVEDGLIQPKYNGNGKTSTIHYDHARLMELDASNRIVIRKGYIRDEIKTVKS